MRLCIEARSGFLGCPSFDFHSPLHCKRVWVYPYLHTQQAPSIKWDTPEKLAALLVCPAEPAATPPAEAVAIRL